MNLTRRACRFLSSSCGVAAVGGIVVVVASPVGEWWLKLIVIVTVVPVMYVAVRRFYGDVQLWDWGCGRSRDGRDVDSD